jgi:hypothetical protein
VFEVSKSPRNVIIPDFFKIVGDTVEMYKQTHSLVYVHRDILKLLGYNALFRSYVCMVNISYGIEYRVYIYIYKASTALELQPVNKRKTVLPIEVLSF